jgi:hypothetical protein
MPQNNKDCPCDFSTFAALLPELAISVLVPMIALKAHNYSAELACLTKAVVSVLLLPPMVPREAPHA